MEAETSASVICATDVDTVSLTDGGAMIVDVKSGRCWQLNRVGADTWALLQKGSDVPTLVDAIVERYEVDRAEVEADIARILQDLTAQGLVTSAAAPHRR